MSELPEKTWWRVNHHNIPEEVVVLWRGGVWISFVQAPCDPEKSMPSSGLTSEIFETREECVAMCTKKLASQMAAIGETLRSLHEDKNP